MLTERPSRLDILDAIQRRVLWLSTLIVHHANTVRPNADGSKVGGHQASSASVVAILTALYLDFLRAGDRVSIKPHASPVFHAIQYLLGRLDRRYLTELRAFGGLQAYPSRTKDPDVVDFSTGSVGLGCVAPNYAALVERYVSDHFGAPTQANRYVSVVGDAELDEGSVWETIAEPALEGLDNVIWVVDLNRQSLDRVVPGIRAGRLARMFDANGWKVIEAKYGRRLLDAFGRPGGEDLRRVIDDMSNEEYQSLLRAPVDDMRRRVEELGGNGVRVFTREPDFATTFADLGGHDVGVLCETLAEADAAPQPAVIFAYTVKGWGLPIAGDPLNHSALLDQAQMDALRSDLDVPAQDTWAPFSTGSAEAELCAAAAERLHVAPEPALRSFVVPAEISGGYPERISSQRAFGVALTRIARSNEELGARMATISPDVATSTNLGAWLNRYGVWSPIARDMSFASSERLVRWDYRPDGRHIELGISEINLFLALSQLGLSAELTGQRLFPIGTLYDPFVCRGLDAFIYALYAGAKFIVAGTPSGVTLSWEGGAHQSVITPSIGAELPGVTFFEPCFAQEVEWILLDGLRRIADGEDSTYLRLSTKTIDQSLFPSDTMRESVLAGGYRLVDRSSAADYQPGRNVVTLVATGAIIPEAVAASEALLEDDIYVDVINVTSVDRLFRRYRARAGAAVVGELDPAPLLAELVPEGARRGPLVSVIDGHPSTLAWLGSAIGVDQYPLGVAGFGQSGSRDELYRHFGIDTDAIAEACISALWSSNPISKPVLS